MFGTKPPPLLVQQPDEPTSSKFSAESASPAEENELRSVLAFSREMIARGGALKDEVISSDNHAAFSMNELLASASAEARQLLEKIFEVTFTQYETFWSNGKMTSLIKYGKTPTDSERIALSSIEDRKVGDRISRQYPVFYYRKAQALVLHDLPAVTSRCDRAFSLLTSAPPGEKKLLYKKIAEFLTAHVDTFLIRFQAQTDHWMDIKNHVQKPGEFWRRLVKYWHMYDLAQQEEPINMALLEKTRATGQQKIIGPFERIIDGDAEIFALLNFVLEHFSPFISNAEGIKTLLDKMGEERKTLYRQLIIQLQRYINQNPRILNNYELQTFTNIVLKIMSEMTDMTRALNYANL